MSERISWGFFIEADELLLHGRRPRSATCLGDAGERSQELAGGVRRVYQSKNKKGTYAEAAVDRNCEMPDTLEALQALERKVEWWWLSGALHAVAQVQAERPYGDARRFRELQAQARELDRRRVQIAVRIAEIEQNPLN